jgi:uncharacterized membrane protein
MVVRADSKRRGKGARMSTPIEALPSVEAPLQHPDRWRRRIAPGAAFEWLARGWRDMTARPGTSLAIGFIVVVASVAIVAGLFAFGWDYLLFPAFAGFMIVGPVLAVGLYEQSRRIAAGETVRLADVLFVRVKSGGQILFTGVLLCLLMLLWMRAAIIIYALFFGLLPFSGLDHIMSLLLGTPLGWTMLVVGTAVGGIFAAFSFAISAVSIPMLLEERVDALTAMGTSLALVSNNLPVMLVWGAIVLAGFVASLATGLLGLLVVFPVLGHGTWHAYRALRPNAGVPVDAGGRG